MALLAEERRLDMAHAVAAERSYAVACYRSSAGEAVLALEALIASPRPASGEEATVVRGLALARLGQSERLEGGLHRCSCQLQGTVRERLELPAAPKMKKLHLNDSREG
ncbi:hypothetical protein ACTHPH_11860 [Paenibacillus pasadenensis]|uniref:hypothetical protein n=1 Tax=Paenibacillus TaxID=44249 RepID=UPI000409D68C|nr:MULTISPECIES: hypothetical protein [Paenibacillus]QGG55955.1 hypothetical protein GE073_10480 [Paenibacillus sp. B01]